MKEKQKRTSLEFDNFTDFFKAFQQKKHPFFVAAHRGLWVKAPENSIAAVKECLALHIYLIELDLQKTKDGHLIVMHDATVDRTTNGKGQISDLSLSDIHSLFLKEGKGGSQAPLTSEKVPTFREVLALVKGKAMINADKAWLYREQLYEILDETDSFDHVLLKSEEPVEKVLEFLHANKKAMHYMHKLHDKNLAQLDELLDQVSPIAVELLFYSEQDQVISKAVFDQLKNRTNIWGNSLDGAENAGHFDSLSKTDPDKGWGWLLDRGFNILQTDYAVEAFQYAQQRK